MAGNESGRSLKMNPTFSALRFLRWRLVKALAAYFYLFKTGNDKSVLIGSEVAKPASTRQYAGYRHRRLFIECPSYFAICLCLYA